MFIRLSADKDSESGMEMQMRRNVFNLGLGRCRNNMSVGKECTSIAMCFPHFHFSVFREFFKYLKRMLKAMLLDSAFLQNDIKNQTQ